MCEQPAVRSSGFRAEHRDILPERRIAHVGEIYLDDSRLSVSLATARRQARNGHGRCRLSVARRSLVCGISTDARRPRGGGICAAAGALSICAPFPPKRDAAAQVARMMVGVITSWRPRFRARGITTEVIHLCCGLDGSAVPANSTGCRAGVQLA